MHGRGQGLTRAPSSEVARQGIYVNSIAVSVLPHDMDKLTTAQQKRLSDEMGPLGRIGTCDEVAEAALFFATDASNLTTGHALSVCGGLW